MKIPKPPVVDREQIYKTIVNEINTFTPLLYQLESLNSSPNTRYLKQAVLRFLMSSLMVKDQTEGKVTNEFVNKVKKSLDIFREENFKKLEEKEDSFINNPNYSRPPL